MKAIIGQVVALGLPKPNLLQSDPKKGDYVGGKEDFIQENIAPSIAALEKEIADLKYKPIDITNVSNDVGTAELGRMVEAVKITWALNKPATSLTIDGRPVDKSATAVTLYNLNLTTQKTFTVTATDERGATDSGSTTVNFFNGVYYGAAAAGVVPDSAAILGLTRRLQSGRGVSIPYTHGDGKRPTYACPSRYGAPKFTIGPNEYSWTKLGTVDFTNASGYTEKYDVWQHPQDISENITIVVS